MRKLATIVKIEELQPIQGADKIETARVRGWWVVVKKGDFKIGDTAVYFEIDSLLPDKPEYEFLKRGSALKSSTLDGAVVTGIRLKTIRLRGALSQGLLLPVPKELKEVYVGQDVSEELGVFKYEAPIPAQLSGIAKGSFPGFIPKTDEERIQNMAEVINGYYVTEKLDGSSVTFYKKDGVFGACSRNLELVEGDSTQWKIARELNIVEKLPEGFAIQGELVGEGIQKNPLNITGHKVFFYNVFHIDAVRYLGHEQFVEFITGLGLETVPILETNFALPRTVDEVLKYAEGKSALCPTAEREGVVVRPMIEKQHRNGRFSFKAISNNYLLNEE